MRVLDDIERVRTEKDGKDLHEQVCWRLKVLGGAIDLTTSEHRFAFKDVLDAFIPSGYQLVLDAGEPCRGTLDQGGLIEFTGRLVAQGNAVAELERRLHVGQRWADHRRIRVIPRYRGNRIAPRSLIKSVDLYDKLAFEYVHVRAAFSGSWYWAQWGFHFEDESERAKIQAHAQEIIDAFGGGLDATTLQHPIQFARLGEPEAVSFDELCDALPHRRDGYEGIASDNGIGMHDPVPFGRLVLLTGPSWYGRLELSGADRLIFDDLAARIRAAEGAI